MKKMNSSTSSFSKLFLCFRCLIFIAVIAVFLQLVSFKLKKEKDELDKPDHQDEKISGIANHKINAELPIFGSSVAYLHFNPDILSQNLGKSVYNFGLDGVSLVQYQGLLKEFLAYTDADLIVIASTYYELGGRTKIHKIEKYEPFLDNDNIYDALFEIDPVSTLKYKYLPFYELVMNNEDYRKIILRQYYTYSDSRRCNGYESIDKKWLEENWMSADDFIVQAPISNEAVESYEDIILTANEKGIKILLVLTPVYSEGLEKIKNLDEVRAFFKRLAGNENYFIDFTKHDICKNKNYFYNYTHLNAKGSEIFSSEFSKIALKMQIFNSIPQ